MNSERRAGTRSDIGVVGTTAADVATRLDEAGHDARALDPDGADTADVVVAMGESALLALVRTGVSTPVLPVDIDAGIEDVPESSLEAAIEAYEAGEAATVDRPLLSASVGDETYDALMDLMAVTSEPAKISEFTVATMTRGDRRAVDTVRADGVVVATSAGTPGYATAAGGPVLEPESSGVAVVPVGPFRIEQLHWVLELPASLTVAREEAAVSLLVDDEDVGTVPAHEPIELSWGNSIVLLRTPASRSPFAEPER